MADLDPTVDGTAGADEWSNLHLEEGSQAGEQPPESRDSTPTGKTAYCEECQELIPWKGKGRKPRFCQLHKRPLGETRSSTGATKTRGTSKVDKEAKELADAYLRLLQQGSIYLSLVEPYDGMAIFAASQQNAQLFQGMVAQQDRLRASLLAARGGSSTGAFIFSTVGTILLPILAHHGVIPKTIKLNGRDVPLGELIVTIPETMQKLSENIAAANQADTLQVMRDAATTEQTESRKDAA